MNPLCLISRVLLAIVGSALIGVFPPYPVFPITGTIELLRQKLTLGNEELQQLFQNRSPRFGSEELSEDRPKKQKQDALV